MDPRTREQLDVCRPGRADWEDSELAQLADELRNNRELRDLAARLEDLDHAIAAALIDVAPPPGLAQRIMARLDQAHAQPADQAAASRPLDLSEAVGPRERGALSDTLDPSEPSAAAQPAAVAEPKRRLLSRRGWLAIVGTAAVAAALLMLAFVPWGAPRLTPDEIVHGADQIYQQELRRHEGWQAIEPGTEPEMPRDLLARPVAWRSARVQGADAVAYDVQNAQARRAVLMAIACRSADLPTSPPLQPQSSSGRMIAAWRSPQSNTVYVLVVEGTLADYQSFVVLGRTLT